MEMNAIILVFILLIILVLRIRYMKKIIIFENEKAILFRNGKLKKILSPGNYWINPTITKIQKYDFRPRFTSISGQEILSSNGVSIKITIAANYQILDLQKVFISTQDYTESIHLILQLKLREIIGKNPIEDILDKRSELNKELLEISKKDVSEIGVQFNSVQIKDIMFPGNLKQIFAQVAKARQEGLAALEKARAETAALRKLANAAKMLENNPALMQLRLIQSLGESEGNTLILNTNSSDGMVIPSKKLKAT